MIFVAGIRKLNLEGFSEKFRLIIGVIEGGSDWLIWAIDDPSLYLWVLSEEELLLRIQEGLHVSGILPLNVKKRNLLISPLKLMQLDIDDLRSIVKGENDTDRILEEYSLRTRDDLNKGLAFLVQLKVREHLIFQVMSLADQLRIFNLSQTDSNIGDAGLDQEAAAFAVDQAQTPGEFADRYRFYLAVQEKLSASGSKSARKSRAQSAWDTLAPLCNGLLETFSFNIGTYTQVRAIDIASNIGSRRSGGFKIGFLCKSAAICNIMKYSGFTDQKGAEARKIIQTYMDRAEEIIKNGEHEEIRLSQDGMTRSFRFEKSGGNAVVDLDAWGIVTLESCQPGLKE